MTKSTTIGVPKEIKDHENRVAMLPSGARELVNRGHKVIVQKSAGAGASEIAILLTEEHLIVE